MPEGLSVTAANQCLSTLASNYTWAKLHVGAPGAAATANAAVEATRKQVTWSTPASAAMDNATTALQWVNVAGSEDYTHITLWTASTGGTFGFSGTIVANPVTASDNFTIAVGDLDVVFSTAS